MANLQVDVEVANRFISSLSKSLQALCHGCMDFDSGIEIVGYININIDSGSKVDYVLNEKVLKSTTNSMTFVSNSFLAKKDVPKQTQDGACSPIPELRPQPQTPYYRGAYQGPRSSIHFSHSQNYRGSQKRTWPGMERDWRMSPKKYRGGRMSHHPGFQGGSMSQNTAHTQSHLSGTQTADSETEFKVPVPSDRNQLPDAQSPVNVKKEVMDSDNSQDSLQSDQNTTEQSLPTSQINIKKDPDAEGSQNLNEAQTDPAYESASASAVDGDFKGTFLQPENDPSYTENIGEAGTSQNAELNSTVDPSNQNSSLLSEHSDMSNIPGEYGATSDSYADAVPSCSGEFGETAGDESFSQSAYSDAGEGSNDGGQFEVIEIEDEDEDVQGLFGDTRIHTRMPCPESETAVADVLQYARSAGMPVSSSPMGSPMQRPSSSATFLRHQDTVNHLSEKHGSALPNACHLCGKSYQTPYGLEIHMQSLHQGKTYACPVCKHRFLHRCTLRRHLKTIHEVAQCLTCLELFKMGQEYTQHVLHCKKAT